MRIIGCTFLLAGTAVFPSAEGGMAAASRQAPTTLVDPPWSHTLGFNRARQVHLSIYSGYRKRFSSPQGITAVKHTFNDEKGPGDDDELTVYGINSGTCEIIYNTSRVSLGFYGKRGCGKGELLRPVGIAAHREGWVAVADCGNNRVVYLMNEDNSLRDLGSITLEETGIPFRSPHGLAMEGDRLYIADTGNSRIVVTDSKGSFLEAIDGFIAPFDIAVVSDPEWNYYSSRFMVVTDSLNQRLRKLTLDGKTLETKRFHEVSGQAGGFFFVAVDYYSNVYATDTLGGCLYKFDRHLNYITRIGSGSGEPTDLEGPRGIAIYRRFGQVFVAEREGASYYWIGTDVLNLSCEAQAREGIVLLNVRFVLTEQSTVTVRFEDRYGRTVRLLAENIFIDPGRVTKTYQLEESSLPCPVAKCEYMVTVVAKPTYSSKRHLTVEKKSPVREK